jgi:hypothetical protein
MAIRFTGNTKETVYNIVTKTGNTVGIYNQLYGGFYQGFFKLFGYDYETFPNRTNKGWSVEMLLRARQEDQFIPTTGQTTLNLTYPNNENTFFYFGTRAENKYYHQAVGHPDSDTGYTRVTEVLSGCLKTCACALTGVTLSRCLDNIYEPLVYTSQHNVNCNCGCLETSVPNGDKDPLFDSMSNTFSLRLSGDPSNPKVCIKVLKFTGGCEVTGSCETTGITYTTGYTISEYCSSNRIFDYCANVNPDFLNKEHWFLIDCVWERNTYLDTCDLYYRGGLSTISSTHYVNSLAGNSVSLITVPYTQSGATPAEQVEIVNLNEKWLTQTDYRLGSLKIYVNGKLFYVVNGFEEIIPRGLNTEKEKQIGVPFNLSWGGGTQGLRESLTFKECPTSLTGLTYQQDPEVMPNETLSGTSLSALTTNILIEPTFGGSFDGAISQFRMYTEPLTYPEIIHNFSILKSTFNLFDYRCPDCSDSLVNDIIYVKSEIQITFNSYNFSTYSYTLYYLPENGTERIEIDSLPPDSFPITFDLTSPPFPPFDGFGTYYFYFNEIDQTISVDVSSLNSVLLVIPGGYLFVGGGGDDYLVV